MENTQPTVHVSISDNDLETYRNLTYMQGHHNVMVGSEQRLRTQ